MMESCGDILALPENCIATVLSLTSPKDACRLALVASTFRSASLSDSVWERFLPSDYRDIISRAVGGSDSLLDTIHSKKDLFFYLCDHPVLIDDGHKSFTLENHSGKKCYMLAARDLSIVWGDAPKYRRWISLPESRFSEVAELPEFCQLEIRGKINTNMLSPGTNYTAHLVFTCNSITYGLKYPPVEASVGLIGLETRKRPICLEPWNVQNEPVYIRRRSLSLTRSETVLDLNIEYPKKREDGWVEVELGEHFVGGGEDGDLEISLMQVKGGQWKSGLVIEGVEIRPKKLAWIPKPESKAELPTWNFSSRSIPENSGQRWSKLVNSQPRSS